MNIQEKTVTTIDALVAACEDRSISHITVHGNLIGAPSCRLSPGQSRARRMKGQASISAMEPMAFSFLPTIGFTMQRVEANRSNLR